MVTWNRSGEGQTEFGQLVFRQFLSLLGVNAVLGARSQQKTIKPESSAVVWLVMAFGAGTSVLIPRLSENSDAERRELQRHWSNAGTFYWSVVGFEPTSGLPLRWSNKITRDKGRLSNWGVHSLIAWAPET